MELYFPIDNDEIQRKRPGPNFKVPVIPVRKRRGSQREPTKAVVAGEIERSRGLHTGLTKPLPESITMHMNRKPVSYDKLKAYHKKGIIRLDSGYTSTHPDNVHATADMLRHQKEKGSDNGHKYGKVVPVTAEGSTGKKETWAAGYHHSGKKNWFAE